MAPARNDVASKPKADWHCAVCTKKVGRPWIVNGLFNYCRRCDGLRRHVHDGNVPLSSPSTSKVHPPRPGTASAWSNRDALAKVAALEKEKNAALAKVAAFEK